MHERNIFKEKKPDFEKLALEYKEFAPYVEKGVSGKCYVNFKDPASLRALSLVLLKKYFNISLEIPLDRLVPTIPLRLNYIHWIEDLLQNVTSGPSVHGIDIGCGASCVYALLGSSMNKWKFVATEIDKYSEGFARNNIKLNKMDQEVELLKVSPSDPPLSVILKSSERKKFHFCMCNPPFFSEVHEESAKNRTDHRPPPESVSTASEGESSTVGGEVEFVKKMIDDSLTLKESICWFTSMVGRKSSLKPIIRYLKSNDVDKYVSTDFKQGKTMRWGIAWTFTETVIKKPTTESTKKSKPLFLQPSDSFYDDSGIPHLQTIMSKTRIADIMLKISQLLTVELKKLGIVLEEPARILLQNRIAYEVTGEAFSNTWTHQRRKRRERKMEEKQQIDIESAETQEEENIEKVSDVANDLENHPDVESDRTKKRKASVDDSDIDCSSAKRRTLTPGTDKSDEDDQCARIDTSNPLFEFSVTVGQVNQLSLSTSSDMVLSFLCLSGNRDQFYQLFTYFKNVVQGTQLQLKLFI